MTCLSFGPSSALRERTNTISMRPFTRLEDEPKSVAIWDIYFVPDPYKAYRRKNKVFRTEANINWAPILSSRFFQSEFGCGAPEESVSPAELF